VAPAAFGTTEHHEAQQIRQKSRDFMAFDEDQPQVKNYGVRTTASEFLHEKMT
jgi:hypothetical protein